MEDANVWRLESSSESKACRSQRLFRVKRERRVEQLLMQVISIKIHYWHKEHKIMNSFNTRLDLCSLCQSRMQRLREALYINGEEACNDGHYHIQVSKERHQWEEDTKRDSEATTSSSMSSPTGGYNRKAFCVTLALSLSLYNNNNYNNLMNTITLAIFILI